MSPATVATSTTHHAVKDGYQRKGFYAAGLFWAFYSDGTNAGWVFTNDPTNWAGAFEPIGPVYNGYGFSFGIWFDGTYVHYTRHFNYDLYYRRGTPQDDGTIIWSAAEQLVHNGISTNDLSYPGICVDTSGYAWIGAYYDKSDGDDLPVILKNANNDGTWAEDFMYELNAFDSPEWRVCPVPLTSAKVYVVYARHDSPPLGRLYDAGWGAEESDLADYNIYQGRLFSAVAYGDNIHFVYTCIGGASPMQIRHNERVWGAGWNADDVLIRDGMDTFTGPVLSIDPSVGNLYCFWTTRPTAHHVFYKKYTDGAWGDLVDWIDESIDDIKYSYLISSFYQDYGGYVGLFYVTRVASPYNVKFAFLDLPPDPIPPKEGFTASDRLAMLIKAGII